MVLDDTDIQHMFGKKIGDIINEETKIPTKFTDGYEVKDQILSEGSLFKESGNDMDVLTDFRNHLVICFKNKQPVCLFHVYDIYSTSLNEERGLVTAVGHETTHEYWFDNGEYTENHFR